MNKEYLAPLAVFAIVFVGAAFLITSAVVSLNNGKSAFWTSKKMKLGAILITLNSCIMSGCLPSCQTTCYDTASPDPQVTCYDMPATNVVDINAEDFEQKKSNIITGTIYDPEADEYSYLFVNSKTKDTLQKGNFKLNTNDTLPYERSFSVEINAKVETGRYYFSVCRKDDYNIQFDSHQINIE